MRLIHLADIHLSFRQFQRLSPDGCNQRELDVEKTWDWTVNRIIQLQPDLILIAGDLFHHSHPSNRAVRAAVQGFLALRKDLPHVPICLAAGNHDVSPTRDVGSALGLLSDVIGDVYIAESESRLFRLPDFGVTVECVPEGCQPEYRGDILCYHGEVDLMPKASHRAPTVESLQRYQYAALGHYHDMTLWGHVGYSGSLDYTSSDPWHEHGSKGFVEWDTEQRVHTVHLAPVRAHGEIRFGVAGWEKEKVTERIRDRLSYVHDGACIRIVIEDCPYSLSARDFPEARRFLHCQILTERPKRAPIQWGTPGNKRPTLETIVRTYMQARAEELHLSTDEQVGYMQAFDASWQTARDAITETPAEAES